MTERVATGSTFVRLRKDAPIRYTTMPSPVGQLTLVGDGHTLTHLAMEGHDDAQPAIRADWIKDDNGFVEARSQLTEYFDGERREFTIPLAPTGTEFRMRVWTALCHVPYGDTASYGEVATMIGNPNASRAVGMANHYNPIAIIVPCHRVVGSNGSLTGYGGGLDRKTYLLELEGTSLVASPR